jgi:serine/threonine protein kinase
MPPMSSPEIAPVNEGEILDGKYRVDRVLGVGGMGIVVAATHVALNQRVAIKFLLPSAVGNAQIIERFAREARAAVQIQSEHVARVIDVGTLPTGSPYMVMEFLEGTDLAEAVEKGGAMPVAQAVSYVLQACEALAEAHALGIVHRDLKPANLFLARRAGRDSIVKVLDFGISKTSEKGPSGLTQTSAVMGSPFYMAPEQMMSSKDVDARSDIWALGIILYELLAGAPPFVADTMAEIVFMVTQRDAPPLGTKRPDVPPELAEVIARCMLRESAQRYPNVAKLAAALAPFGPPRSDISVERISRVLGASVPPSGSEVHAPHRMHGTASTWANSQAGTRRPTKAPLAIALAGGACVLVLGSGILWRALRTPDAAPVTAPSVANPLPSSPPPNSSAVPGPSVAAALAPLPEPSAVPPPAASASAPALVTLRSPPGRPHGQQPAPSAAPPASPPPPPPPTANHGMSMGMKE